MARIDHHVSRPGRIAAAARQAAPLLTAVLAVACKAADDQPPAPNTAAATAEADTAMNRTAERYVRLVLAVGRHDPDYVDAYYGPPEWRAEADAAGLSLEAIRAAAEPLAARAAAIDVEAADSMVRLRRDYLSRQLEALNARVRMLQGQRLSFDEEAQALYDVTPPTRDFSHYDSLLERLDPLLPGEGTTAERYARFREAYIIPPARVDTVFRAAIAEARRRTARNLVLPEGETFKLEYVTGKTWSGYNWYQGDAQSLIQINIDLPITIDRAVDLAAHEGYPGHHVYNALLEQHLVRERGWMEFSVYPLFSPQSLIAEGSANYGVRVAFPGTERVTFEREVLYPLAGLDPSGAALYADVQQLAEDLSYAGNDAARLYLDGAIDADSAAALLHRYALMPPDRAEQRVRFIDQYRAYVINYNLGQDLVRQYVEVQGGTASRPARRWEIFGALLSSPRLPSGLR